MTIFYDLTYRTPVARQRFLALDAFTRGFVESAFWVFDDDDLDRLGKVFDDLDPAALAKMEADCQRFQAENAEPLALAYAFAGGYTPREAGRDFYLTRSRADVGFWSRGFGDQDQPGTLGFALCKAAEAYPPLHLIRDARGFHLGVL